MKHIIRLVDLSDSEDILNIYKPFIMNTSITFETEIPSINEFTHRIESISKEYQFPMKKV